MSVLQRIKDGKPVNVTALAEEAGVSAPTLYRAIADGQIPVIRIGKRMTVPAHIARKLLQLPETMPDAPIAA